MKTKIIVILVLIVFSGLSNAADLIKAQITPSAIGLPCCLFQFGVLGQGVTLSSDFTITNNSPFTPVVYTVSTEAPFSATPSTGILSPNRSVKITVQVTGASQDSPEITKAVLISAKNNITTQKIDTWVAKVTMAGPKPDLTVSSKPPFVTQQGANANSVELPLSVNNQKNLRASLSCQGKVFIGNNQAATFSVPSIVGGTTRSVTVRFDTNRSGSQVMRIVVDSDNQNVELREDNNETQLNVTLP